MILKLITRFVLVLLAAGLVAGGFYLAFDNNGTDGSFQARRGWQAGQTSTFDGNQSGLSQGRHNGDGSEIDGGVISSFSLMNIFQKVLIIGFVTLIVVMIEKLNHLSKRKRVISSPTLK